MYTQEDRRLVEKELKKRRLITAIPSGALFAAAIVVFIICQVNRQAWGWIFACCATLVGGAYAIFLYGVYVKPMALYRQHVDYMLDGNMRETTGILQAVAGVPADKDGLDCFQLTINVGDKKAPEDERLLYYDALKGRPEIPLGTRVTALSNDKMISELRVA